MPAPRPHWLIRWRDAEHDFDGVMIDLDSAHDCADEFTCAVPIEPFEALSLERERTARRNSRARVGPRANVKILVRLASNYMLPMSVGNPTEDLSVAPRLIVRGKRK